jgi:hypothetical protein
MILGASFAVRKWFSCERCRRCGVAIAAVPWRMMAP